MLLRINRNDGASRTGFRFPALKKVFAAGFLFFFIKGLLWLAVGGLAVAGIV